MLALTRGNSSTCLGDLYRSKTLIFAIVKIDLRYSMKKQSLDPQHEARIHSELRKAGVTDFGMKKFAIRDLPSLIGKDEHIEGVIYGRYKYEDGSPFNEGVLVATDLRVLFLDHKPGYQKTDEITYDVVSGIKKTKAIFTAVTLHTRLGDFSLRFTNSNCADIFVRYVESRRLKSKDSGV